MRSLTFSVAGILMVAVALGCGQPFTLITGSGGSSGSASSAGGSTSKSSTSSGPACTPGDLTTCMGADMYCAATTPPTCMPCADIGARFVFGTGQKLAFTPPDMTTNPSYPRIGISNGKPGGLFFTYLLTTGNPNTDIGEAEPTMNAQQWMKGVAEGPTVNTMAGEAGELFLPTGKAIEKLVGTVDTTKPVLLFHRVDTMAMPTTEKIFVSDGTNSEELILPKLPLPQETRNYNIAVAEHANDPPAEPAQLWYVSNINFMTDELVTHVPGSSTSASILITLDNGCTTTGAITPFHPWVDPTGHWLLISSPYPDKASNCKPVPGAAAHLFYIDLKAGNPVMPQAKPIFPDDKMSNLLTPAMNENLCVLYYTEQNGGSTDVYSAIRQ